MGRIMSDALNISVNYTVSLGPAPDVTSSAINCQSSFVLQEAYLRDKILQDELQELAEQRSLYSVYTDLIAFWEHVLNMRKFKLPPEPPPPPPPPPVDAGAPPAPPQLVTYDEQTDQFRRVQAQIAIRITELEKIVAVCTTSRTQVCGLPKNEVRAIP
jgi:hypothetical protein